VGTLRSLLARSAMRPANLTGRAAQALCLRRARAYARRYAAKCHIAYSPPQRVAHGYAYLYALRLCNHARLLRAAHLGTLAAAAWQLTLTHKYHRAH